MVAFATRRPAQLSLFYEIRVYLKLDFDKRESKMILNFD